MPEEKFPQSENFPLPENSSVVDVPGDLEPKPDRRYPFNSYVDAEGDMHFRVSEIGNEDDIKPQAKQMVTAELASLVVPIAPVFKKKMPEGGVDYFSVDVKEHGQFDMAKKDDKVGAYLMYTLFKDSDHFGANLEGGIFFDFGVSDLKNPVTADDMRDWNEYLPKYLLHNPKSLKEFVYRVNYFKNHIEGKNGLNFIASVCERAGYTEVTPQTIQKNLLERISVVEGIIASLKNTNQVSPQKKTDKQK